MDEPVRVLLGPTAVGKTAVSLFLAEALDAEIVSVDSRQIYRGMEIGSAAPTAAERERVPHHLVGEVLPVRTMTAGEYGRLAQGAVEAIRGRGRTPLLVGGSGLYLRAALGGLDEELPQDERVRAKLRERLQREGVQALYAELMEKDPVTAGNVSWRDTQRVLRALEIVSVSGRPASELRTRGRNTTVAAEIVVLDRTREDLEERIRRRVDAMVAAGLEAEVSRLLERGLEPASPPLKSVGYAETIRFFDGELDPDAWREEIVVNTRRFAKRQRTWFRGLEEARWLEVAAPETPETTARLVREIWGGAADA